jgi:hypothetical protein
MAAGAAGSGFSPDSDQDEDPMTALDWAMVEPGAPVGVGQAREASEDGTAHPVLGSWVWAGSDGGAGSPEHWLR